MLRLVVEDVVGGKMERFEVRVVEVVIDGGGGYG